ncbi:phosphoribosylanthranilate isomerase [Psychroserpens sp. XS_ASV72]|uniref:phosphoribosylanthranilate isomerase n=1 Tax=Psychroserpens sp. XS_ASV72 TaxID=3241293 RepID=UPI00351569B7
MKLKVCGMTNTENIKTIAELNPDYLGFIFYEKSTRFFDGKIPDLPEHIKKVGVFVNAEINVVMDSVKKHNLNAVQLHGNESPEYCLKLKGLEVEIIKVFSIHDNFDFSVLRPYETGCDYFLFDTKGKLPGGNGYTFNWNILNKYSSTKPFFLSGGIGLEETKELQLFLKTEASTYCYAIDVNSKFEIEPGLKNHKDLKQFMYELQY